MQYAAALATKAIMHRLGKLVLATLASLLLLVPAVALSQDAPSGGFTPFSLPPGASSANTSQVDFTASNTDISIGLLQKILGNWKASAPDPVIGELFRRLNLVILVFGAALFIYVAVVGTLHSAEDSEILGKKWNTAFVPLRMSFGFSMLFPLANGFSAVQMVVLWLATNGVGAANWVMDQTIDAFATHQGTVVEAQLIDAPSLTNTMAGILRAEVCVAEHNRQLINASASPNGAALFGGPTIEQSENFTNSYAKATWGPLPGSGSVASTTPADACGSIEIPNFNSSFGGAIGNGTGLASDAASTAVGWLSAGIKGVDLQLANTTLRRAHFDAIINAASQLRGVAQRFVNGEYSEPSSDSGQQTLGTQVVAVAMQYQQRLADAMNTPGLIPSTSEMASIMSANTHRNGWASLGTFYYQYARIGSELSKMTGYTPKVKFPSDTLDRNSSVAAGDAGSVPFMMQAVDAALAQSAANPATASQLQDASGHFTAGTAQGGIIGGIVQGTNVLANNSAQWLGEAFGVDPNNKTNAVIQLKNVGDNILSAAELLYMSKKAVETAANSTPGGGIASTLVNVAGGGGAKSFMGKLMGGFLDDTGSVMHYVLLFAMFAMLSFGMILAFWVPMAPFILWLGGVTGWIIAVLEMVAAAPLWAAAHLHPDGEGMASRWGANGYMIILEVFAKPVLMVVGFFLAARFVDPFLRFSSALFFNNMATVNGDSVAGILTTIAFMFMYVAFCVSLVNRSFSLITIIPNSVLRWVGSHGDKFSQVGDIAQELEGKVGQYFQRAQSVFGGAGRAGASQKIMEGGIENAVQNGMNSAKRVPGNRRLE